MKTSFHLTKVIYAVSALLISCSFSRAQVVSDFNTLGGDNFGGVWVDAGAISFDSGTAVVGSPALGDGNFEFADISAGSISLENDFVLQYRARTNTGNFSNSFVVRFADDEGNYAAQAIVVTTAWVQGAWTTGTATLSFSGGGDPSTATYFTVTGDGSSNAFRMSFDSFVISAIPEPASIAVLLGLVTVGICGLRRRRVAR